MSQADPFQGIEVNGTVHMPSGSLKLSAGTAVGHLQFPLNIPLKPVQEKSFSTSKAILDIRG
jgi:hypothetical protein